MKKEKNGAKDQHFYCIKSFKIEKKWYKNSLQTRISVEYGC